MKKFDVNEFKKEHGFNNRLNPYMYEDFKTVNPKLTKKMYDFLRGNKTEWKILCGVRVEMEFENEVLEENLSLKLVNSHIYPKRHNSDFYLNVKNWKTYDEEESKVTQLILAQYFDQKSSF